MCAKLLLVCCRQTREIYYTVFKHTILLRTSNALIDRYRPFFRQNAILAYQSYLIVYNLNSNKIKKAALFLSLRVGEFHCLCYTSLLKPMYSELQSRFVFKSCSHAQKQGQLFRIPETTLSLVRALRNTLLHEYPNSFNYLAATIEDKS